MTTDKIQCPCCHSTDIAEIVPGGDLFSCQYCQCCWYESMRRPEPAALKAHEEAMQLLCAAHMIAERRGNDVHWSRFAASIKKCLEQFGINNPVTARVYRYTEE